MEIALLSLPEAAIAIPTAAQCFAVLAPVLALAAFWWLLGRIDRVIHHLFPTLAWQRQLGWLNIRAERQAGTMLRWMGYAVYATLAAALVGILWGAAGLRGLSAQSDAAQVFHAAVRLPVLIVCLGMWLFYLGGGLLPKLRRDYEEEELARFRAEFVTTGGEEEAPSRLRRAEKSRHPVPPRPRSRR